MFWAVAIGPVQLSLSIRELKKQLAETRQRDSRVHLEVQAVEEMLRQARDNYNQLWCLLKHGFTIVVLGNSTRHREGVCMASSE